MAEKMTCPGCDSHTSSVLRAVRDGEPCPYCGLSAAAILEIDRLHESRASEEMQAKYREALVRAETAEREAQKLRNALDHIRRAVRETGDA